MTKKSSTGAGVFRDVINSIFEPGVNRGVMVVMNCAFMGLFAILVYLMFATRFNLHVCALSAIAILLFASIQWFVKEISAIKATQAAPSKRSQAKPKKKKL
ncbi:ER protein Pkr1-domain-containing protein [Coemansia mojavensis]|nr:ER protein Pkr1-domain-containing protein [Coemansia mojavensis]